MKKIVIILTFMVLWSTILSAQPVTIKGKVSDKTGIGLPGASVAVKGTTIGTVSDATGNFSLSVPAGARNLIFSFIGKTSQELPIGEKTVFDVVLEEDIASLDEVVVVGYGTMKRRDVIGATAAVRGTDIANAPVASAAEAIIGRMAGVQVTTTEGQPGAEIVLKIRGGTSISQDNSPLYIVDGFPSEEGLKNISISDIQSIDVLKDASSTAIYGARGANGVVLITTKGGSEGKSNITYDGWAGFKTLGKKLEVMDGMEFLRYQYERQANTGTPEPSSTFLTKYGPWNSFDRYKDVPSINWQEEILGGNAYYQNHNISINGGTKTTSYRLSYSHDDEDGLLAGNGFDRNNFKLRLDQKVNDKLSFSSNAGYSITNVYGGGTSEKSILNNVVMYRPIAGLGDPAVGPDPTEMDYEDFLQSDADQVSGLVNIATESKAKHRLKANGVLTFNAAVDYLLTPKLTLRLLGGMTLDNQRREEFDDYNSSQVITAGGPFGLIRVEDFKKYNNTSLLTYKTTIRDVSDVSLMIGQEYVIDDYKMVEASAAMYDSDDIGLASLEMGNQFPKPRSRLESNKLLSFFTRAYYSYKNKYLFTGTLRADGSSKFIEANRWGYFPSAAIAWQASEEDFIRKLNTFSNLKVRLTYGVAGNNRISNNQYASTFKNVFYAADGTVSSVGLIPNATANPDLKWETTISRNLGFDVGFLNNRITGNFDLYLNTTKDLLLQTQIPSTSGYTTQFKNVGSTENRGIEITVNTRNFNSKNFYWNTDFNIAFFKNKVTGLNKEATFSQESFISTIYWSANQEAFLVKVGEPLGLIYGFVSDGFYTVDDFNYNPTTKVYTIKDGVTRISGATPKPGDMKFKDQGGALDATGNPTITISEDRTIIGKTQPKFFGGINNTFTYKNFDMSIFVNFSVGNDILNANKILYSSGYATNRNLLAVMRGYFTYVNDNGEFISDPDALRELNKDAKIWAPERDLPRRVYSWAVEDGSFLRINNITLGYTLPGALSKKVKIDKLRIFATGYNLFLLTKYSGFDPEVNGVRSTPYTPGVDQSSYPKSKSFIAGLNITF
jgi:TonB-dependent starch-binding outer membrane protein SusC